MMKRLLRFLWRKALHLRSLGLRGVNARRRRPVAPVIAMQRPVPRHEGEIVAISETLEGWLNPPASLLTIHLVSILPDGPAMEIGVYRGKYLSVLRSCFGPACRIVGYDIFEDQQPGRVATAFDAAFPEGSNLALITIDSTRLTPEAVLRDCGAAPVFISIDGSHEAGPVFSDLRLAASVLADVGIVAVDDVLNPLALGVPEGLVRFLMTGPDLVPFAYASNKMFLCRADRHAAYSASVSAYLDGRGNDPSFALYRRLRTQKDDARRMFLGSRVIVAA